MPMETSSERPVYPWGVCFSLDDETLDKLDLDCDCSAGDEIEILEDREVLVKAKFLRHVTDVAPDVVRLLHDIEAQALARAAVGREQPAEHADRRRLAAAVGAEKAADLALGELQI